MKVLLFCVLCLKNKEKIYFYYGKFVYSDNLV